MSARVLIADPNEHLLAAYRKCLSQHGFDVATATNGLECVEQLRQFMPDVLVFEPAMPWGGGDGVLAVMHEQPGTSKVRVMVLTHGCSAAVLYNLARFRLDDYQLKPLGAKQLADRIRKLVVGSRPEPGFAGERAAS
jgi:DNA-binding response OmpR family regulator